MEETIRKSLRRDVALIVAGVMMLAQMVAQLAGLVPAAVGVYDDCAWWHCLTWMWFHGGWWHYAVNVWTWLAVMFLWNSVRLRDAAVAVIAAAVYGLMCKSAEPVVGMSGVIYALLGVCSLRPHGLIGKVRYSAYVAAGMIVTGVLTHVAAEAHVVCYLEGAAWAALNYRFIK